LSFDKIYQNKVFCKALTGHLMNSLIICILTFLLGGALGGLIAYLVARSRIGAQLSRGLSQSSAEIARLQENIHSKEKELQDRNRRIGDLQAGLSQAEATILGL